MKTIFKTLALGLLITAFAACEMHDPFDENTITGAVGPEAYWTIESSMVKAGESMNFVGQYYSTAAKIDHSEVWYDLWEKEERLVTASLIKAFTFSYSQNPIAQKRMLQTIAKYNHSEDLWSDSLHAYVLTDKFPISNTLAPISWVQPKDLKDFDKNLNAYFGQDFAKNFKDSLTRTKMNDGDKRHYAAYMNVLQGLSHLTDTILTPNGDRMPYVQWITDSTYNANTATWVRDFKQNDTIWSKTDFDTLNTIIRDTFKVTTNRYGKKDTTYYTDTTYVLHPIMVETNYVYDQIVHAIDSVWENHVTFQDLIYGSEGYSIEYKREYYINAELRIYDENGTYSKTDSKEININ
jgi:hypothetical protein